MNNIFFNSNYFFNLRKDVKDTSQASLINVLLLNAYMSRNSLATAKAFINTTISNLSNLNKVVETKPDVAQINSIVQTTVQATVQEAVSNVMDAQIQQAISAINIEKQNAINAIHSYNGAGINESIQSAITQLNDKTQVVLNDINSLAESVSYQISNMNAYTKEELLQKIDFLFEMFYHADSETIMELYPL